MANKKPSSIMTSGGGGGGMMRSFVDRLKLVTRLIGDRRVSAFLKIIPVASAIYFLSPVDLAPGIAFPVIGVLDDAAILWIGSVLFVELCPPSVVKEHQAELKSNLDDDDVVDADSTDVNS